MTNQFFIALLCFLTIPLIVSKFLRIEKVFPLVFLQLLLGLFIHLSGLDVRLQAHGFDLNQGPLAYSLSGMGVLAVSLLIALAGSEAASQEGGRGVLRFIPISVAGFFGTCALGSLIGYNLFDAYPGIAGVRADRMIFSLAIGLSLSVTALPVLISILHDVGMAGTGIGNLATNCAVLDDLWMWLCVAVVLSLAAAGNQPLVIVLSLGAYLVVTYFVARPLLKRLFARRTAMKPVDRMLISVSVIFLSAIATDVIGLHCILGAFVGGAILPASALTGWREPLLQFSQTLLLPFFFILTGMRLHIDIGDALFWKLTLIVTLGAVVGKFVSVSLMARLTGLRWSQGFMLGSLMQCKGLMELVAINILLEAGIIGPQVFSALAMMALVSTFVTAPAMQLISRRKSVGSDLVSFDAAPVMKSYGADRAA